MHTVSATETQEEQHGSFLSYTLGFVGSLLCTFAAFGAVMGHVFPVAVGIVVILLLALLQLGIQLALFLHVGRKGSKWNTVAFTFAGIIVAIVVIGSLWIMYNLNQRMMPSTAKMIQYMQTQDW